jgi:uncharacterized RDD family membrane protein YckC
VVNDSQPPPLPINRETAGIAGFWRRLFAFFIDGCVLGIPTFVLGLLLFDQFAQLGGWGRLVGFIISLLYFGLMNSALAGGQTFGKHLMKIRVVDLNNSLISLPISFVRYSILGLPYFLNGAAIPPRALMGGIALALSFIIFGMGLSIIYLFVFNRRNRRSLHDLIVGTYVVKTNAAAGPKPKTWAGHYVVVALLCAVSSLAPLLLKGVANRPFFKELLTLQTVLLDQRDVGTASVYAGTNAFWGKNGRQASTDLSVSILVTKHVDDYDSLANKIAQLVIANYPEALQKDRILIGIVYGYDLGIARSHVYRGYNYSPSEWQQRIQSGAKSSP